MGFLNQLQDSVVDPETELKVWTTAIVSNMTTHDRNISYACTQELIKKIRERFPHIKTTYFWSDGCAGK